MAMQLTFNTAEGEKKTITSTALEQSTCTFTTDDHAVWLFPATAARRNVEESQQRARILATLLDLTIFPLAGQLIRDARGERGCWLAHFPSLADIEGAFNGQFHKLAFVDMPMMDPANPSGWSSNKASAFHRIGPALFDTMRNGYDPRKEFVLVCLYVHHTGLILTAVVVQLVCIQVTNVHDDKYPGYRYTYFKSYPADVADLVKPYKHFRIGEN